jgi:eukaryotic-like serine/threonine-protein kinase
MTATRARPFEPGARVGGKYDLVRLLASGGMGEVWMARNVATGGHVAVKRCLEDTPGQEAAERFRYEARLGAMLSHRGIVRVFDLVEERGARPVLVMELLRGESLERALARHGPMPEREALAVAVGVLAALAHAHDRGVTHRDITPANVFLAVDPDGHVTPKLVDFGLAKLPATGVRTIEGRVLGTPRYMAPERIRGAGDVDARSDLFSVGVVLFEMLTGANPFAASTPAASLAAVLEVVVDPDPRIGPRVWVEVQRALAKRPYERPASARELADALLAAAGETETSLAECLRRPPLTEDAPASLPAAPSAGHSIGRSSALSTRRSRALRWVVAASVLAVAAVGLEAAIRLASPPEAIASPVARGAPPATVEALAATAPPTPSTPSTPPTPPTLPTLPTLPTIVVPSPSYVPAATRPAARPLRTKPIATTPGF